MMFVIVETLVVVAIFCRDDNECGMLQPMTTWVVVCQGKNVIDGDGKNLFYLMKIQKVLFTITK
jgi:hypothetical protein